MSIFYYLFLLLAFPLFCEGQVSWQASAPGGFAAKVALSTSSLSLNDSFNIYLTLTYPHSYHPDFPALGKNLLTQGGLGEPPFSLVSETINPPQAQQGGLITQEVIYVLEPQVPGKHPLTFQNILFQPNNPRQGNPVAIISEIFSIAVAMPPSDFHYAALVAPLMPLSQKFPVEMDPFNRKNLLYHDLLVEQEAQRNIKLFQDKAFPWSSLAILLLIVILILIMKMSPPFAAQQKEEAPKISLKARVKALQTLDHLSQEGLPKKNLFDLFFVKLTQIVRLYIEERYRLNAPTYTSQEFFEKSIQHPAFDDKTRHLLMDFFQSSDRVKFAHYHPSLEECVQAERQARAFIEGF
jgi:hypothetical protein